MCNISNRAVFADLLDQFRDLPSDGARLEAIKKLPDAERLFALFDEWVASNAPGTQTEKRSIESMLCIQQLVRRSYAPHRG